jgi:hypothetical protein
MKEEPKKIYVYKMTVDNGGAPCVYRGQLSLAICKPEIRRMAEKGSIIFGFAAKKLSSDERLIYIAVVKEKLSNGDYYLGDLGYENRPDCIYKLGNDGKTAKRKKNAKYHAKSDERKRDVGMKFEKADVLLSEDFRYFGKNGNANYKGKYPKIKLVVAKLKQGHRVNHDKELHDELLRLQEETWQKYPKRKKLGNPTTSDRSGVCNRPNPSASCEGGFVSPKSLAIRATREPKILGTLVPCRKPRATSAA